MKMKREDRQIPDLARERKNLWNIKVTVIANIDGAIGTVHKSLEKSL